VDSQSPCFHAVVLRKKHIGSQTRPKAC
jgi:hypothetical protein